MAPRQEHAFSCVLSSHVRSRDEKSIIVEAGGFRPTRWFLERGFHARPDDSEPPKKRPKIQQQDITSRVTSGDSTATDIPLYEAIIDFHYPETLKTEAASPKTIDSDVSFDESQSFSVTPYGFDTDHSGTRLRLALPQVTDPVLVLECATIPEDTLSLLRDIASPGRLLAAILNRKKEVRPASIARCTITQSTGELNVVRLKATLHWRSGLPAFSTFTKSGRRGPIEVYADHEFLARTFPNRGKEQTGNNKPWTPQDFYESVNALNLPEEVSGIYDNILESALFPFQKRAVSWMLNREGVKFNGMRIEPLSEREKYKNMISLFEPAKDMSGEPCFVNHVQGIIARKLPDDAMMHVSGGLLAEEMGLGKTVELIATITLHQRTKGDLGVVTDEFSGAQVTPSKATLIITPPAILEQWRSELGRHAPALSVFHYTGLHHATDNKKVTRLEQDLLEDLSNKYDVVLTTYNTLAKELHFAEDPPERNMRHQRKFARRRSPLIQVQWWRICLDEAQMVESGVTAAARVACRLPRVHSWAVSGTPLRKNVQDLLGLLIFLRYRPFSQDPRLWNHLITDHRYLFRKIFGQIALRHTKAQVRDELRLPSQKRVVVNVPFSVIEEQNYSSLFASMCEEVGLWANGEPLDGYWDPNHPRTIERMRSWLSRLRETCLHPQVGYKNRKALGRGRGPLRTVAEVLDVMIEQNETGLRLEERAHVSASMIRAQILGNNAEDQHRSQTALSTYEEVMQSTEDMVVEARRRLLAAESEEVIHADTVADTDDEDSSAESTPLRGRLKNDLRTALQLQHMATFFVATSYFQIKSNDTLTVPESERFKQLEEKETSLYEIAKTLRKEILKETSHKAEYMMRTMSQMEKAKSLTSLPNIRDLPSLGGIESRRIVDKSDEVFDVIREQTKVMVEWRSKMAEYLQKPLVDEDEGKETTGDEYEDSTKQQDELYVYFDAFKAMQADLNTLVTGEYSPLTDHEVKYMITNAKKFLDPDVPDDQKAPVHAPALTLDLLGIRNDFRKRKNEVSSLRGLIHEARALENATAMGDDGTRAQNEHQIIQRLLADLQVVFTAYTKALAGLEKDLALFRALQNHRVEFYRQLQELSDAVAPYKEELDERLDQQALDTATRKEERHRKALAAHRTKNRFLLNLRHESGAQAGPRICVICQCSFEQGVLTVCGHQYCRECIQHWFTQARTCPICKRKLARVDMHDITYRPQELRAQEEANHVLSSPEQPHGATDRTRQDSIYSDVDSRLLDEIKAIDLPQSYGVKIDTLGRHLTWIRQHDAGAKSIVFSQYREFLDVLGTALSNFKIGYARLGRSGAVEKFRYDASIDCLLLDAKTDSSGLTLVNATHVFICEPLIQTAVELQAIARVHRIGQTRPTTVWMYLIRDTVEEAVYEISVARRLAHVQARNPQDKVMSLSEKASGKTRAGTFTPTQLSQENALEAANSEELQSAPLTKLLVAGKGGGEMVERGDLWQCLFGAAQKAPSRKNREEAQRAVDGHLRGEAAEQRREETARAAN